jgi:hypothetical protein
VLEDLIVTLVNLAIGRPRNVAAGFAISLADAFAARRHMGQTST